MNHNVFTENTRLADLILANYSLLYVLPCFGMELGFGERTVKQVCDEKGVSTALFLIVCNVYTFDDYEPGSLEMAGIPLVGLMAYLKNSHKDYLETRMPKIIGRILDMVKDCNVRNIEALAGFCDKYRQEVVTHFNYEEQVVFPYISALLKGEETDKYNIKEYESNHSDLDGALSDLKNIMIKYLPEEYTIEKCRDVLIDLFMFESDLSKHTLLEDHILIALVERMECKN